MNDFLQSHPENNKTKNIYFIALASEYFLYVQKSTSKN